MGNKSFIGECNFVRFLIFLSELHFSLVRSKDASSILLVKTTANTVLLFVNLLSLSSLSDNFHSKVDYSLMVSQKYSGFDGYFLVVIYILGSKLYE